MKIGQPAVPVLIGEFRRQNSQVRRSHFYRQAWTYLPGSVQAHLPPPLSAVGTMPALAYTLGLLGPAARDSVPILASGAKKNSDPTVRSYSIWAMGQIGGDKAEAAVASYLLDVDPRIRHDAESASNMMSFRKRALSP